LGERADLKPGLFGRARTPRPSTAVLVRLLSNILAGRLLHVLTAASGTQQKVGRAAKAGPHLWVDRTLGSAARRALSPSAHEPADIERICALKCASPCDED